jgi:ADP-ribose pyrophosphatase
MSAIDPPEPDTAVWTGRFLEMHVAPFGLYGHWEYVRRRHGVEAAVILALTGDGAVVLVEQFRAPLGRPCIELPAGLVGDDVAGEAALESARRELAEETGFEAEQWHYIGPFASSPGMVGEVFHFYRATGLRRIGPGGGVHGEDITVHLVPLDAVPGFLDGARARGAMLDTRLLMLLRLV